MILYKSFFKVAVMAFAVPALLVSCGNAKQESKEGEKEEVLPDDIVEMRIDQQKLADIQMGSIQMLSLSGTLKVNGLISVSPENYASVCAPMGGFVKSTSQIPGNFVKRGQVLAMIENSEFIDLQQRYLETKNRYEFAEADYKRHTELYKSDVYSLQNVQQVTSDYKSLKAQLKALEQKLELIGIKAGKLREDNISRAVPLQSPISGYIKTVNVNLGKYVSPSDVMFEIVNGDKLFLELTIFEKDADKVAVGQPIRFFINNETEQHEASIYQMGKSVGADKTFKAYALVKNRCKNVLPGMYASALIETSSSKVTSLPSDAIVNFDDKDFIFIFDRNKTENGKPITEYRMIQVQKGVTDGANTEIVLPKGFDIKRAKVVVKGAYSLLSAKKNAGEMSC